jgi:hypothetical protein
MQIITIDDRDFSTLLDAWRNGKLVGSYEKNGKVQVVIATRQFMLVSTEGDQKKIALKPSRSLSDAESCALQFLLREEQRGVPVTLSDEFESRKS